jgi:hypothetical protein
MCRALDPFVRPCRFELVQELIKDLDLLATEPVVTSVSVRLSSFLHCAVHLADYSRSDLGWIRMGRTVFPSGVGPFVSTVAHSSLIVRSVGLVFKTLYNFNAAQSGLVFLTVV